LQEARDPSNQFRKSPWSNQFRNEWDFFFFFFFFEQLLLLETAVQGKKRLGNISTKWLCSPRWNHYDPSNTDIKRTWRTVERCCTSGSSCRFTEQVLTTEGRPGDGQCVCRSDGHRRGVAAGEGLEVDDADVLDFWAPPPTNASADERSFHHMTLPPSTSPSHMASSSLHKNQCHCVWTLCQQYKPVRICN